MSDLKFGALMVLAGSIVGLAIGFVVFLLALHVLPH